MAQVKLQYHLTPGQDKFIQRIIERTNQLIPLPPLHDSQQKFSVWGSISDGYSVCDYTLRARGKDRRFRFFTAIRCEQDHSLWFFIKGDIDVYVSPASRKFDQIDVWYDMEAYHPNSPAETIVDQVDWLKSKEFESLKFLPSWLVTDQPSAIKTIMGIFKMCIRNCDWKNQFEQEEPEASDIDFVDALFDQDACNEANGITDTPPSTPELLDESDSEYL